MGAGPGAGLQQTQEAEQLPPGDIDMGEDFDFEGSQADWPVDSEMLPQDGGEERP